MRTMNMVLMALSWVLMLTGFDMGEWIMGFAMLGTLLAGMYIESKMAGARMADSIRRNV